MSFPPIPNTPVKATRPCASRHKKREASSSFPSIAKLNLFRKKPPQHFPLVEPYEAAPGIWSTDAAARVFGYLETNDKRTESRVQSAAPDICQKAKRKPLPRECKQAHSAENTERHNTDTIRDEAEASPRSRKGRRDEPEITRGDWSGVRRARMRTVSRDGQLVERGANPRTGLVSPFVVSDNSEDCLEGDYIARGEVASGAPSPRRETRSGKWKQDSLGWSLVETSLLSPIAQSMSDKMSRTASKKHLEDRLPAEMPRVDSPDPENMTNGQIKKYQEEIARAYRRGGGSIAMLDPDTLTSPRQWTPQGSITPPTRFHKIQRKEVGSGVLRNSSSGDTVIIKAKNRASSPPTPRKDIMKRQEVMIAAPSNTPKGSSFESCADNSKAMGKTDHFLGRGCRTPYSQAASATRSQSYLSAGQVYGCLQDESKSSPSSTLSDRPPTSPTLTQYLPRLQFLHPSHFANLETSSYRRPKQLLPARLRLPRQQRQAVEDVCTTTFTTTSAEVPRWEQRPKMQRQEGNSVVPRVNHLSPKCETPLNGYPQSCAPRMKHSYASAIPADTLITSDFVTGRSRAIEPTEKADPVRNLVETRYQRKTQMPADCLGQSPCEDRPKILASPVQMARGLSLGSVNVVRQRYQRTQGGDECILTYDHHGNESEVVPYTTDDKEQANLPAELTIAGDSKAWFAGNWAEVEKEGETPDLTALVQEEALASRRSVVRKKADVKSLLYAAEAWVEPLAKLGYIQQVLYQMIRHVIGTFRHGLPALISLRAADATQRDRFRAMKDLALAAVYLLVLLNLFMVLRGMLVFVSKVLYWIWHPVQTILVIIGWCVVG
ncbi:hypothetical protein IMSHALPRED_008722 [Imshaugia aleurites]|uniref:Uncharacterized protein n=1 Tax=Imshaugia aleurites TaxID=172621 RepID=A0A8H3FVQ2_9LECA|nr:hypothetical protein IMSHALPRED_008722 [Imshaugia aleurites]